MVDIQRNHRLVLTAKELLVIDSMLIQRRYQLDELLNDSEVDGRQFSPGHEIVKQGFDDCIVLGEKIEGALFVLQLKGLKNLGLTT